MLHKIQQQPTLLGLVFLCRPLISKPFPLKFLNTRIPIIINKKGRGLLIWGLGQGLETVGFQGSVTSPN